MSLSNILLIPGVGTYLDEVRGLLFNAGQQGGIWVPSWSDSMIQGSTFGTGVQNFLDLSGLGNTFTQATPSSRSAWFREPWTGRRNLAINTEAPDTYTTSANCPLTSTVNIGSFTLGEFTPDVGVSSDSVNGVVVPVVRRGESQVTVSFICRPANGVTQYRTVRNNVQTAVLNVTWNFATQSTSITLGTGTATIQDIGGGLFRCSFSFTNIAGADLAQNIGYTFCPLNAAGSGESFLFGAFQPELGSTATAYQRVTTAFDVTEAGQRDCYGVRFDGTDDGYATAGNVDFSGTANVTVFAAIRKLSDASGGNVVLLGSSGSNGFFSMTAPSVAFTNVRFDSRGTTTRFVERTVVSPAYRILTGEASISSPYVRIRSVSPDGSVATQSNTDSQGTGNYANAILSISDSLRFNGNIYALIVAGGSYSLSTIQRVERLLSRITPTVNL